MPSRYITKFEVNNRGVLSVHVSETPDVAVILNLPDKVSKVIFREQVLFAYGQNYEAAARLFERLEALLTEDVADAAAIAQAKSIVEACKLVFDHANRNQFTQMTKHPHLIGHLTMKDARIKRRVTDEDGTERWVTES